MMVNQNLVGGFSPTPLKNDGVRTGWDYEIPNLWKHKNSCSKPPTREVGMISMIHCNDSISIR